MIFEIERNCAIKDLPEPIRTAAIKNITRCGIPGTTIESDVNDIIWDKTYEIDIDDNADAEVWSKVYNGGTVEIKQKYLDFWNYKPEPSIKIERSENGIYYGTVNNKKVKIEITYEE